MGRKKKRVAGKKASSSRSGSRRRRSAADRSRLVLYVLVAAILLISFPWLRRVVSGQLIRMVSAEQGVIELVAPGDGLVVRGETSVSTPIAGTLTILQAEGSRVRVGTPIGRITNNEARGQAEGQAQAAEGRLAEYRAAKAAQVAELTTALADLDRRVNTALIEVQKASFKLDLKALDAAAALARKLSQTRAETSGRLEAVKSGEKALEQEAAAARALVDKANTELTAPAAGVVSFIRDGLESEMTPASLASLNGKKVMASTPQATVVKNGDAVKAGQSVFKIIDSIRVYVAVVLPSEQLSSVQGKTMVTIRFPELKGQAVAAAVERVGQRERNGYGLAVFSTDQFLTEFATQRRTPVQVVKDSFAGVIVPRGALAKRDGQDGVFILRKSQVVFKPVTVLGGDGRRSAVEGIQGGAQVVTNPWLVIGTEQQIQ
ncbi:MAG TPA: HlyD family efflux transporter periplasmic adaptor subunit [Bacillota bacterium]